MRRKKDRSNGITALYERLSRDDDNAGESNSIVHQKQMLEDYAIKHGFTNLVHFKDAPQVVDRHVQPVVDPMMVYSGCFCNVSVNFYPFNANGNRGVAVGLGNIQFVKDGDRLSGRASADADFDALEDDEDVLGGDAGEELPDYLK